MKRIFKYICFSLIVLFFIGFLYQFICTKIDDKNYPPPGKMVDIGGYKLHLNCMGNHEEGKPTIVLDAGLGGFSLDWIWVQREVSKVARVCSYDRAGYGWSDKSPNPRSSKYIVNELHQLLINAQENPPYILVGHSFGGINVRLFADSFASEVKGLVLVDSSHEAQDTLPQTPDDFSFHSFEKFVLKRPWLTTLVSSSGLVRLFLYLKGTEFLPNDFPLETKKMVVAKTSSTKYIESISLERIHFKESLVQLKEAMTHEGHGLSQIPFYVITAGKSEHWPDMNDKWQKWAEENYRVWKRLQEDLVQKSTNGKQIFAENSGHDIPHQEPQVIVKAIQELFEAY